MKRSALRKVSRKPHRLAKRFIPLSTQKAIAIRSGGRCERIRWFNDLDVQCERKAVTFHHVVKRTQGGRDHNLEDTKHSCNECNIEAEEYPRVCIEDGWVKPWKGYEHPRDFQAYLTSKGLK